MRECRQSPAHVFRVYFRALLESVSQRAQKTMTMASPHRHDGSIERLRVNRDENEGMQTRSAGTILALVSYSFN